MAKTKEPAEPAESDTGSDEKAATGGAVKGLIRAYRYGRDQQVSLEEKRAQQMTLWYQYRALLRDRRALLEKARKLPGEPVTAPGRSELIGQLEADILDLEHSTDDAEKAMNVLNAERDRFMVDVRANLSLGLSVMGLCISLTALIVAVLVAVLKLR